MDGQSRARLRWRQVVLFVAAMLVPCAVLLILGARTIEQERQLEEDRLAKVRQAAIERTRQQLLSELETIKLQQLELGVPEPDPLNAAHRCGRSWRRSGLSRCRLTPRWSCSRRSVSISYIPIPLSNPITGDKIFRGKAACTSCHAGPMFSDDEFHNTGVA